MSMSCLLSLLVVVLHHAHLVAGQSPPKFVENFNGLTGTSAGTQAGTSYPLYSHGSLPGWTVTGGTNPMYFVQHDTGNFALQIYDGDVYRSNPISNINDRGKRYVVRVLVGATGSAGGFGTDNTIFLRWEFLRQFDNSVLFTHFVYIDAWVGPDHKSQELRLKTFEYIGDGSGPLIIKFLDPYADGRYNCAIDDLSVSVASSENSNIRGSYEFYRPFQNFTPAVVNGYTAGAQSGAKMCELTNGNIAMIYQDGAADGSAWGVFGQIFQKDGTKVGSHFGPVNTMTGGDQYPKSITCLANGNFLAVVLDVTGADGNGYGSFARFYDNTGAAQGAMTQVAVETTGTQEVFGCVQLINNNIVCAYHTSHSSYAFEIRFRIYVNGVGWEGSSTWVDGDTNTGSNTWQTWPTALALSNGGFVIAFGGDGVNGDTSRKICYRFYNGDGSSAGPVRCLPSAQHSQPRLARVDANTIFLTHNDPLGARGFSIDITTQLTKTAPFTLVKQGLGGVTVTSGPDGLVALLGKVSGKTRLYGAFINITSEEIISDFQLWAPPLSAMQDTEVVPETMLYLADEKMFAFVYTDANADPDNWGIYFHKVPSPSRALPTNEQWELTILAGKPYTVAGAKTDGGKSTALLYNPQGGSVVGTSFFFGDGPLVRKVDLDSGVVTSVAGDFASTGCTAADGLSARFGLPIGYALLGPSNDIFIASFNHLIQKMTTTPPYSVTTIAGQCNVPGGADNAGSGLSAQFNNPRWLTRTDTHLYVSGQSMHSMKRVDLAAPHGTITVAGAYATTAYTDEVVGTSARFNNLFGISKDPISDEVWLCDVGNKRIRKYTISSGQVHLVAGSGTEGHYDGPALAAYFKNPHDITATRTLGAFVVDNVLNGIRRIHNGWVTTIVSSTLGTGGVTSGAGHPTQVLMIAPVMIIVDPNAETTMYISCENSQMLWKLQLVESTSFPSTATMQAPELVPSTDNTKLWPLTAFAGTFNAGGSTDGIDQPSLQNPEVPSIAPDGKLVLLDAVNQKLLTIDPNSRQVTTRVSSLGISQGALHTDGYFYFGARGATSGNSAAFSRIQISDWSGPTLIAGSGAAGSIDHNIGTSATFFWVIYDVICCYQSHLLVVSMNHVIRSVSTQGTFSTATVVGKSGVQGTTDGTGFQGRLFDPRYMSLLPSEDGVAMLADYGDHTIRRVDFPERTVSHGAGRILTWIGAHGTGASTDGARVGVARLSQPHAVAGRRNGDLFICQFNPPVIRLYIKATDTLTTFKTIPLSAYLFSVVESPPGTMYIQLNTAIIKMQFTTRTSTYTHPITHTLSVSWPKSSSISIPPTLTRLPTRTTTLTQTKSDPPTRTRTFTITPAPTPTTTHPITETVTVEPTVTLSQSLSLPPVGCAAFKTSSACFSHVDCFHSDQFYGCMNRTFQHTLANNQIDAKKIPLEADILRSVKIVLYGGNFLNNSKILMTAPTALCPDKSDLHSWNDNSTVTQVTKSTNVEMPIYLYNMSSFSTGVTKDGEFRRPCVRLTSSTGTEALVVDLQQSIKFLFDPRPEILFCKYSDPVYVYDRFHVEVGGFNLRLVDKVAIVPGTDPSLCADKSLRYFSVSAATANREQSSFDYVITEDKSHTVCYIGAQADAAPVHCPEPIQSAGLAPHMDPITLRKVSTDGPRIGSANQDVVSFNIQHCRSSKVTAHRMVDSALTAGPLTHPVASAAEFGNLTNPYGTSDVCVYLMQPPEDGIHASMELYIDLSFADETEKVYVLLPPSNIVAAQAATIENRVGIGYHPSCDPTSVTGFSVAAIYMAAVPGSTNEDGNLLSSHFNLRVPIPGGAVVMVCSDRRMMGGATIAVGYALQPTMCPGDCKDSNGVERGICNAQTRTCACYENYIGADCSTFAGCAGVQADAVSISKPSGTLQYTYNKPPASACAYLVRGDPSNIQKGPSGIGLQIRSAKLSSLDCTKAYIVIHVETWTGTVARRYCKSDLDSARADASLPPLLVNSSDRVYIELRGFVEGDGFRLRFTAVSLGCPGDPGPTGFVTGNDICSGKGSCIDLDYAAQSILSASSKTCACTFPFAPMVPGSTCDSCAFGFKPSSFPNCKRANVCPNNCSNHGTCIEDVGCLCDNGYFGKPCAMKFLPDVAEITSLAMRLVLDNASSADALSQGAVESTLLSCEGEPRCLVVARQKGNLLSNMASNETNSGIQARRQGVANSTNGTAPELVNISSQDTALLLNRLIPQGAVGDYIQRLNVSGTALDIAGPMSLTMWLQVTGDSNGWLYAKTDAWFTNDGESPALEAAAFDIQDRFMPASRLRLAKSSLEVPFGVYLNGKKQRIDVLIQLPRSTNSTTTSANSSTAESWLAVRHFRLQDVSPRLFDGQWRFLTFTLSVTRTAAIEGHVYIDGVTKASDPAFVQCFPFLPPSVRDKVPDGIPEASDPRIGIRYTGGSIIVGYRLQAAVDEYRAYRTPLPHATVVNIGSQELFGYNLAIDSATLIAMAAVGFVFFTFALLFMIQKLFGGQGSRGDITEGDPERGDLIPGGGIATTEEFVLAVKQVLAKKDPNIVEGHGGEEEDAAAPPSLNLLHDNIEAEPVVGEELATPEQQQHDQSKRAERVPAPCLIESTDEMLNVSSHMIEDKISPREPWNDDAIREEQQCNVCEGVNRLDPSTWSLFMKVPPECADAVNDLFRRWMHHWYQHACYGALVRSPSVFDNREVRKLTQTFRKLFQQLVKMQKNGDHVNSLEDLLLQLERFRLCRSEEDFDKFDEVLEKTSPFVPFSSITINDEVGVQNAFSPQIGESNAAESPQCRVERIIAASGVEEPADPLHNRQLLVDINDAFDQDSKKKFVEQADDTKNIVEGAIGVAAAADAVALAAANQPQKNGEENNHDGETKRSPFCIAKGLVNKFNAIRDGWQLVALFLMAMTWPEMFVDIFGRFAGILSLNISLVQNLDFQVTFYLTAIPALAASLFLAVVAAIEKTMEVKELERFFQRFLQRQLDRIAAGENTSRERKGITFMLWAAVVIVTTLYLPCTTNAAIVLFCHPSIQCSFDCTGTDERFQWMFGVSVACVLLVTCLAPIVLFIATFRKLKEFHGFVGVVATKARLDELWELYTRADPSPFAMVYDSYVAGFAFFTCLTMVIKAAMAFVVLGTEPNSQAQIIPTFLIEGMQLVLFAVTAPFTQKAVNTLSFVTQAFVMILLSMNSLNRLNPEAKDFGVLLVVVSSVAVFFQLVLCAR